MANNPLVQDLMSLLRIHCSLADQSLHCDWALLETGREVLTGSGPLSDLSRMAREAGRVQVLLPAAEVLLVQARLPPGVKKMSGTALGYAVEDLIIGDPDKQRVILLDAGDNDSSVLAVMDRTGYDAWLAALNAIGVNNFEVHAEALLLPWHSGEWSLAWDGREGFLRSGEREAGAIDCADRSSPPLALGLLLAETQASGASPPTLAIYPVADRPEASPDISAWSAALGITVRLAAPWNWRRAPREAGLALEIRRRRWRFPDMALRRLRPAIWMLGAAALIHGLALVFDWASLAAERRQLRQQMESRFRATFPDAVAVVDPALQMRRKLAQTRHAAGAVDEGDFLPMAERVAAATRDTPQAGLRGISYESGRMTLEIISPDPAATQRLVIRLSQAGLRVDPEIGRAAKPAGAATLTVRTQ